MLQSVVINRALVDGNKRLGWLSTAVFLVLNGARITQIPNDDVYELAMWIDADNPDVADIVERWSSLPIEFGVSDSS